MPNVKFGNGWIRVERARRNRICRGHQGGYSNLNLPYSEWGISYDDRAIKKGEKYIIVRYRAGRHSLALCKKCAKKAVRMMEQ